MDGVSSSAHSCTFMHACSYYLVSNFSNLCVEGTLDGFLRRYVEKYKFLTITSAEWKENFLQYFHKQVNDDIIHMLHYHINIIMYICIDYDILMVCLFTLFQFVIIIILYRQCRIVCIRVLWLYKYYCV